MGLPDLQLCCETYGLPNDREVEESLEALAKKFLNGNDGPSEATLWIRSFYKASENLNLMKETLHRNF